MKKVAYLDCPTGIAGDMCLGALVHAGVPLDYLREKLSLLGISDEYQLRAELVHRNGQEATKVHVDLTNDHDREEHHIHARHLPEIERTILAAGLPNQAEKMSLAVFRKLAEAEGAVHGVAPEKVHFHEVGATDAIVDIVGTCLGLDWLGIERFYCSPLPTGGGTIKAAHGQMPVPTPAVLKLWEYRQVPVYSNGIEKELVTPTGAAIAVTLADAFGSPPRMTIQKVGLGAGSRQLPIPNILRLWIGEETASTTINNYTATNTELETIAVLSTQIDDLSPQAIAYTFDALLTAGALDVFTQPIVMKKSRQGVLLTVICHPEKQSICETILFRETTTLGIRHCLQQRSILPREIQKVSTPYGEVRVKIAGTNGNITNVQPEYEDCAQLAKENNVSWREIHRLAWQSWYDKHPPTFS
ncbi:nickel pincer cofactor biosynthesis protein LarC [Floridanema evergladense]|uniref:Putative nickel insertion protein n=1 Tax=Floridaenema evergladense BLCC-F167 TaxID=3153639 RepID=A0ABV4WR30_9CYAN